MFQISVLSLTPFAQNTRIISNPKTSHAVVVDPGGEVDTILAHLQKHSLKCTQIWLTHSHLDHCGGVKALKAHTKAELVGHPDEKFLRENVVQICEFYGVPQGLMDNCPEPDKFVSGGEDVYLDEFSFHVLFTPGHSPGHVCFHHAASKILIAGDTLFAGGIGRTDLPGGDYETLMRSIRQEIFTLDPKTAVLPGHGPDTVVEREIKTNPFFAGV